MRRTLAVFAAVLIGAATPGLAVAQQRGATGGATGGAAAFGGGNAGGFAAGGTGGQTLGQGGLNTAAGGASSVNRTFTGDFIGGGDSADRFVGQEAAGTQTGLTRQPNFRGLQGGIQSFQQSAPPQSPVRARLAIGFDPPSPSAVRRQLSPTRNGASAAVPGLTRIDPSLSVGYDGGTAVIRGNVASDRERKLAEALLRLEPGVRQVRSNVSVLQPGTKRPVGSVPAIPPLPTRSPVTLPPPR